MAAMEEVVTGRDSMPVVEPDRLHLASLERIERRFELALRDLRILRREIEHSVSDKGVLGSRSLTEYVLDLIRKSEHGISITNILLDAEKVGYKITTRRVMSKRLTERAYRVGDIQYDRENEVWVWKEIR
jgi:hypothetical protein